MTIDKIVNQDYNNKVNFLAKPLKEEAYIMILKQERPMPELKRKAPNIGEPYKGTQKETPHRFYQRDPTLIVGYREGSKNPYVEKLMEL